MSILPVARKSLKNGYSVSFRETPYSFNRYCVESVSPQGETATTEFFYEEFEAVQQFNKLVDFFTNENLLQ